jgi:hypothetical protein
MTSVASPAPVQAEDSFLQPSKSSVIVPPLLEVNPPLVFAFVHVIVCFEVVCRVGALVLVPVNVADDAASGKIVGFSAIAP